jgi:hypothetical protein
MNLNRGVGNYFFVRDCEGGRRWRRRGLEERRMAGRKWCGEISWEKGSSDAR